MSPIIFNMVIDCLISRLPGEIGATIGGLTINAAAFADDLLLFASTPVGLQKLLDVASGYLNGCGLIVNANKCLTVALRNVPHEKKTVVDKETIFLCDGRILPALKRTDDWIYFGIPFSPEGRLKLNVTRRLQASLEKLTRAPLKPQQRMYALRTMVTPSLFHEMELGNINLSVLRKSDVIVREAVRRWLSLPTDAPNAYMHVDVKSGGLGVPSFRWTAPLRRLERLRRLPIATAPQSGDPGAFHQREIANCKIRLKDGHKQLETKADISYRWATLLHASDDGMGLKEAGRVPQQNSWVQDGTRFLTGKDYLQACKLRINAMPTRSRLSRGRPKDRMCRGGCGKVETLNHVLQQCHRTHGPRIKRYDALVAYVVRGLEAKGYAVHVEPRIEAAMGLRKPDIVAKNENRCQVIDAQVINDQFSLHGAHQNKTALY